MNADENPEREQDRAEDLIDCWRKHGCAMFRQQRAIYGGIGLRLRDGPVLEAGCGAGLGTAMLSRYVNTVVGTDKLMGNVRFARELYPWLKFQPWDVSKEPWPGKFHALVAVEMIEHVADAKAALRNMLHSCTNELWISTPNGRGKPKPPSNPFHVREWTPAEFCALLASFPLVKEFECHGWEDFATQNPASTTVDPLVWHVTKRAT